VDASAATSSADCDSAQGQAIEVEPPLAHQRHDDGAAQQVVARQRQAAHHRQKWPWSSSVVYSSSVLAFWL
jgi:hypothetical protein